MNELLKRITVNPAIMTGLPCIRGMRIPATTILGLLAAGATEKEILADYPDLEPEDIKACLAYAAWLTREREIELQPA
ncbi:MAG TPA: DUF433 domain-containing protein [Pseudomonadales bacterium]|nr:DUF433 domain-containing protein [Pseudomonadales bacterium]